MSYREHTKKIKIGNTVIGGGEKIAIQSMTNTRTEDVKATVAQILQLEAAGCEIIRCTANTEEAAKAFKEIKKQIHIPLVADIHFQYRLAILAMENGADKIRINPGNIGGAERVRRVADACRERGVPIRIGVNSGSVEKHLLEKYGGPTAQALVESALSHARLLEDAGFYDIALSMKASDVKTTIAAYRLMDEQSDYPLHVGVTHTGTHRMGLLKSAAGIGGLLAMGIGNTIRVSLAAEPEEEVRAGYDILRAADVLHDGVRVVCCPGCGRSGIDVVAIAEEVERRLSGVRSPLTVAVCGCVVNGPGEAREADFGVAGGDHVGILFSKGEMIERVPEERLADALCERVFAHIAELPDN